MKIKHYTVTLLALAALSACSTPTPTAAGFRILDGTDRSNIVQPDKSNGFSTKSSDDYVHIQWNAKP